MTVLLLTAEAAAVFGATTWLLLRFWTRSRAVDVDDVVFYDLPSGTWLPRSRSAGPRTVHAQVASGFERSPLGAMIAAINIAYRTLGGAGEQARRSTVSRQVIGDGHDAPPDAPDRRGSTPHPVDRDRLPSPPWYEVEIIGWEVESYSSRRAAIRYLFTRPAATGVPVTTTMRVELNWVDDDWRIVAPSGGDWTRTFEGDADLSGFRPFPPAPPRVSPADVLRVPPAPPRVPPAQPRVPPAQPRVPRVPRP